MSIEKRREVSIAEGEKRRGKEGGGARAGEEGQRGCRCMCALMRFFLLSLLHSFLSLFRARSCTLCLVVEFELDISSSTDEIEYRPISIDLHGSVDYPEWLTEEMSMQPHMLPRLLKNIEEAVWKKKSDDGETHTEAETETETHAQQQRMQEEEEDEDATMDSQ